MKYFKFYFFGTMIFFSCEKTASPKPKAYLRLEYEKPHYRLFKKQKFSFEISDRSKIFEKKKNWCNIKYPKMKATLMLTYKPIEKNLQKLLQDSEKLTFKHVIKADNISSIKYENQERKVFGRLYKISGDAASHLQFHLTDYKKHFMMGVLYFYAKPNYDSILPAVHYLEKDMQHLMDSFKWQ